MKLKVKPSMKTALCIQDKSTFQIKEFSTSLNAGGELGNLEIWLHHKVFIILNLKKLGPKTWKDTLWLFGLSRDTPNWATVSSQNYARQRAPPAGGAQDRLR